MKVRQIGLLVEWECDNPNCQRVVMIPVVALRNAMPGRKIFCSGNNLKHDNGTSFCTNWTTPDEILSALDGPNYKPRPAGNQALPVGDRN